MAEPLVQKIKIDTSEAERGVRTMRTALGAMASRTEEATGLIGGLIARVKALGTAAKVAIASTVVGALVAVVGTLTQATRKAAQFEKQLAEVGTLLDGDVTEALDRFEQGLNDIRRDLPQAKNLVGALYNAISAGVDPDNALNFVREASKAAIAGVTDTQTAVDGLTTVLNAFNKDIRETGAVADSFFKAIEQGKTTFPELASSIGLVAPLADALGISLDEVNAALATLTANGRNTSQATRELRQILNALSKNMDKFQRIGIDVNAVLDERGLQGVLQELKEATGGAQEELQPLLGRIQAVNGVTTLALGSAEEFANNLAEMESKAGSTQAALEKMEEATSNLWQRVKNNLTVAFRQLGTAVLPEVNRRLQQLLVLFGQFEGLQQSDAQQLLGTLRDAEGVDPAVIQQLQATVDTRQAEERIEELRRKIEEETVAIGVDFSGAEPEPIREDLAGVTVEQLQSELTAVNEALQERATRIAELEAQEGDLSDTQARVLEQARDRREVLRSVRTEILSGIKTLSQFEAAQERVEDARERLNSALSDSSEGGGTGGETDQPAFSAEERAQARETLTSLSDQIRKAERLRAADTAEAESILEEIIKTEEQIAQLQEVQNKLRGAGRKEAEELLRILRDRLQELGRALDEAERPALPTPDPAEVEEDMTRIIDTTAQALEQAGDDAFPSFPELLGLDDPSSLITDFRNRIDELRFREQTEESFTEEDFARAARKEAEALRKKILEVIDTMREMGFDVSPEMRDKIVEVFEDIQEIGDDTNDTLGEVSKTLSDLAGITRGVSRLGEELGIVGEKGAETLRALSDVFQGGAKAAKGIASGDPVSAISGSIQAIGGLAETFGGLFGGGGGPNFAELQREIEQNTRKIAQNTKELLEQGQVGGEVSPEDIERAQEIANELGRRIDENFNSLNLERIGLLFERAGELPRVPDLSELVDPISKKLEARFGIESGPERAIQLLTGELTPEELAEVLGVGPEGLDFIQDLLPEDFRPLLDILDTLEEDLGTFSDSVSGAIEELDFMQNFGLGDQASNFQQFIDTILGLDEVSADLKDRLEELAGLDVSTEQGRQRLNEIIAAIASALQAGELDLGGLSPDEVEELLNTLREFTESADETERQRTRATQVRRQITEIQANELIAIGLEQLFTLRSILEAVGGEVPETGFSPLGGGPVELEVDSDIKAIRQAVEAIESGLDLTRTPTDGGGGSGPGRERPDLPPRRPSPGDGAPGQPGPVIEMNISANETPESIAPKLEEAIRQANLSQFGG